MIRGGVVVLAVASDIDMVSEVTYGGKPMIRIGEYGFWFSLFGEWYYATTSCVFAVGETGWTT